MKHVKRWTAGVIFENNKCHLDEEVLQIATDHVKNKEEGYWKRVRKCNDEYNKYKKKNLIKHMTSLQKEIHTTIYLLKS